MKKSDVIDGIQTVLTFALIFAVFILAMIMFTGCGSTNDLCPAYKPKKQVERTTMNSRATDPKPLRKSYKDVQGAR
jgi:hypothetical protein